MQRTALIQQLEASRHFDLIIIGGGATGLGAAVDASARGYTTLLVEAVDFAQGTSSRSTKLVHGGVRYLQQGNIKLVMEALKERGILKKNAAHLVKNQSFIVPNYKWWEGPYYGLGLKVYDWMSGSLGLGTSEWLSAEEVLQCAPTLDPQGLHGGVRYHDGQFDDARLAIHLAQTAVDQGAVVLNYCKVTGLLKANGKISGIALRDTISEKEYEIQAAGLINATGVFSDSVQRMDEPGHKDTLAPSQGIHLVLDRSFLPGDTAIMIPHTDDGRVLFAVPWHQKVIVGTTDTPVSSIDINPLPQEEEIQFLLQHASRYLTQDPRPEDIKSIFAGLRPLVKSTAKTTAALSRDHALLISSSGLVSVIGGKWTTYRKMAEDAVTTAAIQARLPYRECITENLPVHGCQPTDDFTAAGYYYGSDQPLIEQLKQENPQWGAALHPSLPYTFAEIIWAVREEQCQTLEDALSRRTRAILLDTKAALEAAPAVARCMAAEMNKNEAWIEEQLLSFNTIARHHLPGHH
jgi:glycerol-3-phosphate dehydrogenase